MTDIVEKLRVCAGGPGDAHTVVVCRLTRDTARNAADEIERLRGTLRRALRLHDIEQAERPTPNEPIWVKLARQLLERER